MNIFICASKHCYNHIPPVKEQLEGLGHNITLPNSFDDPMQEERLKAEPKKHKEFKDRMFHRQIEKITQCDALLIINEEKAGIPNYIGGSVLLEMYEAWRQGKIIYLWNNIPDNMLKDEIAGLDPIILNKDVQKLNNNITNK